MRKQRTKGWFIVSFCAFLFIISLFVVLIMEIRNNSREVVIKANNTAVVEEKKEKEEEKKEEEVVEEKKEEETVTTTTNSEEEHSYVGEEIEPDAPVVNHYTTRMTSFWPAENNWENECLASSLCMQHMQVNENGWYTYNGRLVIATASTRLGASTQKTYKLYQEVELVINGKTYPAIVLDVCGSCQRNNRIDLYVKDGQYAIDINVEIYF